MAITRLTDADYSSLFKRTYGQYGDNLYGAGVEDPLESQIPKTFDFGGSDHRMSVKIGFGGGTGFGSLPTANMSKNVEVVLSRKKAYARINLDRETIVASRGKASAFKEATQEETIGKLRSFTRTQACALYNDSTGTMFQMNGSSAGTAAAPIVTVLATGTYRVRSGFLEEGDYLNVNSDTSVFEVSEVDLAAGTVTLARLSGALDLTAIGAGDHEFYLQNSKDATPIGLLDVQEFTAGTLFGVTHTRRWTPYLETKASPSLLTTADLNKVVLQMENRSGECPNLIIMSTIQMEKYLNQLEEKKRYTEISSKKNKMAHATASFSAIEFMSVKGAIPIVSSRYVRDDTVMLVNTNKMFRKHAERFGWFDEDRTVLLRMQDEDAYEARYGGYYQNYINPLYQAFITGNAT